MSTPTPFPVDAALEECVDDLDEFVATLERFPDTVVALALRAHLAALLSALVAQGGCSRADIRMFLKGLESEALSAG